MFSTHQRLNVEHPNNKMHDHSRSINKSKYSENKDNFHQWLVGVTDGDGSFTISRLAEGKWTLFFKITQSSYNLRMLYYIKKELGVGSVWITADNQKADFRIRDRKTIGSVILPIFEKYPLLTSKYHSYEKFKKAYYILENTNLSTKEKDDLLLELKKPEMLDNYISPAWSVVNYEINNTNEAKINSLPLYNNIPLEYIKSVLSIYWLIGYVESSLGYFIISSNKDPMVGFMLKATDFLILEFIRRILHIPGRVRYIEEYQYYSLYTANNRAVQNIINKLKKIQTRRLEKAKLKGIKSLMFKLWTKAYFYKDKNLKKFNKLAKIMFRLITKNEKDLIALDMDLIEQQINNDKKSAASQMKAVTVNAQIFNTSRPNQAVLRGGVNCCQRRSASSLSTFKLDPWFVTGFTDAEGYFSISVARVPRLKLGWRVCLQFGYNLHIKDKELLDRIKEFFTVGKVDIGKNNCQFRVTSIEDLELIIKHFDNYPLISQKFSDYQLFKLAFYLIKDKAHLTEEGLNKIISIKSSINLGLSDTLKEAFPNINPVVRPLVIDREIKDPNWLAGFIDGEGCFNINIVKAQSNKTGYQVKARFILAQHSRDIILMQKLLEYLGCGTLSDESNKYIYLTVSKYSELKDIIIPLLNKYPLQGAKKLDFFLFCDLIKLIENKEHLTDSGVKKIMEIKGKMNKQ